MHPSRRSGELPQNDVKFVVKIRPPVSAADQLPGVVIETMVGSYLQNAAAIRHIVENPLLIKVREESFVQVLNQMAFPYIDF